MKKNDLFNLKLEIISLSLASARTIQKSRLCVCFPFFYSAFSHFVRSFIYFYFFLSYAKTNTRPHINSHISINRLLLIKLWKCGIRYIRLRFSDKNNLHFDVGSALCALNILKDESPGHELRVQSKIRNFH